MAIQKVDIMIYSAKGLRALCALLLMGVFVWGLSGCGTERRKREFSDRFKKRMVTVKTTNPELEDLLLHDPEAVAGLYEEEAELVLAKWGNRGKVDEMLEAIRQVSQEGLHPVDYHLEAIESLVDRVFASSESDLEDQVKLELLLSDALLLISSHLSSGKTDSETIDPHWKASKRTTTVDLLSLVDSIVTHGSIKESLLKLTPRHREYNNLRKSLAKYHQLATTGGWEPTAFAVPKLEKGMTHPDVSLLRNRLALTQGNGEAKPESEHLFDQTLHEQVVIFQKRHGLTADGVVGKGTMEALNVPVADRIAAIEASMERWRWLSDDLGERYIKVNIANFELQVVENDQPVFISDAIVGRLYRETPVFSAMMNHLVFAPTWTVPPTILWQDVIPAVKKNQGYLTQKNMQVLRRDGTVVDPNSIDWKNVSRSNFPYMIRQAPGKDNALGAVKFMFPNQYSVYVHDTPTRNLFAHADRSFSSGCIRISKPLELAEFLLQDKPEWTPSQIRKTIEQGRERTVFLSKPIPVHLVYMTAWAEDDGTIHFRKDIYNRDQPLLKALRQQSPIQLRGIEEKLVAL